MGVSLRGKQNVSLLIIPLGACHFKHFNIYIIERVLCGIMEKAGFYYDGKREKRNKGRAGGGAALQRLRHLPGGL
jgi:hypothetical protein